MPCSQIAYQVYTHYTLWQKVRVVMYCCERETIAVSEWLVSCQSCIRTNFTIPEMHCVRCFMFNIWQTHRETERERERERERETDRQTDRQTNRQAGRQAGRQADRYLAKGDCSIGFVIIALTSYYESAVVFIESINCSKYAISIYWIMTVQCCTDPTHCVRNSNTLENYFGNPAGKSALCWFMI